MIFMLVDKMIDEWIVCFYWDNNGPGPSMCLLAPMSLNIFDRRNMDTAERV